MRNDGPTGVSDDHRARTLWIRTVASVDADRFFQNQRRNSAAVVDFALSLGERLSHSIVMSSAKSSRRSMRSFQAFRRISPRTRGADVAPGFLNSRSSVHRFLRVGFRRIRDRSEVLAGCRIRDRQSFATFSVDPIAPMNNFVGTEARMSFSERTLLFPFTNRASKARPIELLVFRNL